MAITPPPTSAEFVDAHTQEREAAAILADTLSAELHLPGARERHRRQLARAIALAEEVLKAADKGPGYARGTSVPTRQRPRSKCGHPGKYGTLPGEAWSNGPVGDNAVGFA